MSAVALHCENHNLAPNGFIQGKLSEWGVREKKKTKPGIVPYYDKIANRLGIQHTKVVLEALGRDRINQIDAYEMLGVQASNFAKLRANRRATSKSKDRDRLHSVRSRIHEPARNAQRGISR